MKRWFREATSETLRHGKNSLKSHSGVTGWSGICEILFLVPVVRPGGCLWFMGFYFLIGLKFRMTTER